MRTPKRPAPYPVDMQRILYRAVAYQPEVLERAWKLAVRAAERDLGLAREGDTIHLPIGGRTVPVKPPRGETFALDLRKPHPKTLAFLVLLKYFAGDDLELRALVSVRDFVEPCKLLEEKGYPVDPWWALGRETLLVVDARGRRYVVEVPAEAGELMGELAETEAEVAGLPNPKAKGVYPELPKGKRLSDAVWQLTGVA